MAIIRQAEYSIDYKVLIIRSAVVEDAKELIDLIKRLDNETTFLLREPDEFNLTLEQEQNFIKDKIDSEGSLFILAELDGKIIGTCGLQGSYRKRLRHTANLGIAISKDYWGLGIGRKLIETAVEWAKSSGISRITLEVDTRNYRAISLYTKVGFEVEGTFKNDKRLADGTYTNGYAMALLIE